MKITIVHNLFDKKDRTELERDYAFRTMREWFESLDDIPGGLEDYTPVISGNIAKWSDEPCFDDEILFTPNIRGGDSFLGVLLGGIVGVLTLGIGLVVGLSTTLGVTLAGAGIASLVGTAVGAVSKALFTPTTPSSTASPNNMNAFVGSETYGWDGIKNVSGEGNVVPIVYGRHRVGGAIIEGFIDSNVENGQATQNFMNMLLAVSEGPIEGFESDSVLINGQEGETFTEVVSTYRTGEFTQAPIPSFNKIAHHYEITSVELKHSASPYVYDTQNACSRVAIQILFSAMYWMVNLPPMGQMLYAHAVGISIWIAPENTENWTSLGMFTVTSCPTKSTVYGNITIDLPYFGKWKVRIYRESADDIWFSMAQTESKSYLKSITEIETGVLSYPCVALVGVRALATDKISNVTPTVTTIIKGRKVRSVKDPSGAERYSSNPADVMLDLLTNPRYGLGKTFTDANVHFQSFVEFADWCDELVSFQYYNGTTGTYVTTQEKRYEFNLVIDKEFTALDIINKILMTCRAMPVWQNNQIRIVIDKPAIPVQLFSMGNIIRDSLEETYYGLLDTPNAIEAQFLDESDDYEQKTICAVDSSRLDEPIDSNSIQLYGLTKKSRVKREVIYALKKAKGIRKFIEFDAGMDAIVAEVGDVILFQHNTPLYGYGGRVESISTTAQKTTLIFDTEYVGVQGEAWRLRVRDDNGEMRYYDFTCPLTGRSDKLALIDRDFSLISTGCVFAIGPVNKEAKPFRIVSISKKNGLLVHLKCEEYNESVYNEDESIQVTLNDFSLLGVVKRYELDGTAAEPSPVPTADNPPATDPYYDIPPYVSDMKVYEAVKAQADGIVSVVTVDWADVFMPDNSLASISTFEVLRSTDGVNWQVIGKTQGTTFYEDVNAPFPATLYYCVRPITNFGVTNSIEKSSIAKNWPITTTGAMPVPANVDGFGAVQNGNFIKFYWNPVLNTSVKHYEIRVDKWDFGTVIGKTKDLNYIHTFCKAGWQTFYIKAVNTSGVYSSEATAFKIYIHDMGLRNLVLEMDDKAENWPGVKDNLTVDAVSNVLVMSSGGVAKYYTAHFANPIPMLARCSYEADFEAQVGCQTPWDSADFIWDDAAKGEAVWSISTDDLTNCKFTEEVTTFLELPSNMLDVIRLSGDTKSIQGNEATYRGGELSYGQAPYHPGIKKNLSAALSWSVNLPDAWSITFTHTIADKSCGGLLISLFDDNRKEIRVVWSGENDVFFMTDGITRINVPMPLVNGDAIVFCISSPSANVFQFMVNNMRTSEVASSTGTLNVGKPTKIANNMIGAKEMFSEELRVKGVMNAKLTKASGEVLLYRAENSIVKGGFDLICEALAATASRPAILSHIAVGTGLTAVDTAQTALVTELIRKAATYAHTAGVASFTLEATLAPGEGTGAITEAGVFNAETAGTMYDRVVFGVINKEAGDTLTLSFTFTFSQ